MLEKRVVIVDGVLEEVSSGFGIDGFDIVSSAFRDCRSIGCGFGGEYVLSMDGIGEAEVWLLRIQSLGIWTITPEGHHI